MSKAIVTDLNDSSKTLNVNTNGQAETEVKATVGLKASELNRDADNDLKVDIKDDTSNEGWLSFAKADNAVASASYAGTSGVTHYITSVFASYTDSLTSKGTLSIKDGSTIISEVDLTDSKTVTFGKPIKITEGNSVSAELSASGSAGIIGKINLTGFSL